MRQEKEERRGRKRWRGKGKEGDTVDSYESIISRHDTLARLIGG